MNEIEALEKIKELEEFIINKCRNDPLHKALTSMSIPVHDIKVHKNGYSIGSEYALYTERFSTDVSYRIRIEDGALYIYPSV